MRRFKFLLLAVTALLTGLPQVKAQKMIGSVVEPDGFSDGMEVVLETRSGTTSSGHYCPSTLILDKDNMHASVTVPSILGINDSVIWVLEKAKFPSYKTGYDQYYLKSKVTGKYLTWRFIRNAQWIYLDKWGKGPVGNGTPSTTLADDTAHAKPFCFIRNDDATWASELGSKKYGSFPANWENTTYVIVSLFNPEETLDPEHPEAGLNGNMTDGNSHGRVYLANEYPSYNITYLTGYQDTNVWDVRRVTDRDTDPRGALSALCDNIQGDVESEFKLGSDPGYISDTLAYNNFYNTLNDALMDVDDASVSADKLNEDFDKLLAAQASIYAEKSREPVSDGYYYIKTANSAFTEAANGEFGWYNDGLSTLRWMAMDSTNNKFIWEVKNLGDTVWNNTTYKLYSFRNALTGKYVGKAQTHGDGSIATMTDSFDSNANLMLCLPLDHSGVFNVTSMTDWFSYPPRPYHQADHNGGKGTNGNIVLWEGQIGSPSAWYIHRVPKDVVDHMKDYAVYDDLVLKIAKYANTTANAKVGKLPGMVSDSTIWADADTAMSKAQAALKLTDRKSAEVTAARDNLIEKMEAFKKDVNTLPDGYYRIKGNYSRYAQNENYIYLNLFSDSLPGWAHLENTLDYVWKVTRLADGNYTLQNAKNGKYINKATSPVNNAIVNLSAQPENETVITTISPDGQWKIHAVADSTFSLDPWGHDNGLNDANKIELWSPAVRGGGTSWTFLPVSEEEYNALKSGEAANEAVVALKNKFREARRAFNDKTNYTLGDKIITEKSQLYGNNYSVNEGTNIENLIDGDKNTTWCSTWEDGKEQNPAEPHYLRVYDEAGFPDTVQVNYVQRQNGTWHRVPTSLRIDVSNDTINWTTIPTAQMRLADMGGRALLESVHADSLHYIVSGIGGYKYVRFVAQCTYRGADGTYFGPNSHAIFEYAEFNLFPVTGVSADSYSQTGLHKAYADALFSAIQTAYPLVKEGKGDDAVLARLTKALDDFNATSDNDSIVAMARFNVERLTAGTEIGQVPQDIHDAYVASATASLKKYDDLVAVAAPDVDAVNAAVDELRAAFATVQKNVVKFTTDKWYYIESAAPEGTSAEADGYYNKSRDEVRGAAVYVLSNDSKGTVEGNYTDGAQLRWGMDDIKANSRPTDGDIDALWCFIPAPDSLGYGENAYYIRNMRTGFYFGNTSNNVNDPYINQNAAPSPYRITFIGGEQFHIAPINGGVLTGCNLTFGSNARQVRPVVLSTYYDDIASVTFKEFNTTDNPTVMLPVHNNSIFISCLPFALNEISGAVAYTLHSKKDSTAIRLKEKTSFAAGEPMIMMVGDTSLYSSDHALTDIEIATPSVALAAQPDTVNGLIGIFNQAELRINGAGYIEANKLRAKVSTYTMPSFSGYINPGLIVNGEGESDAVFTLSGSGFLNDIRPASAAASAKVDVYSVEGVLLKHNVDAAEAAAGLSRGVYIIGGKTVLVR